jgi:ubiquinone/menaquinone biosynthesis C-methylase UbiE
MEKRPISIENCWDILYREYPDIYDAFASVPYTPNKIEVLHERFNLANKIIVDVGSGSGRSSMALAKYAKHVIGIEPEQSMRELAQQNTLKHGLNNIVYVNGRAEHIPLDDDAVDMVIALTAVMYPPEDVIPAFIREARRVIQSSGSIISIDVAPGWYGGELAHIIDDPGAERELQAKHRLFVEESGFAYVDVMQTSDYGSVEKMIRTYGFIFGEQVIGYIKQNKMSSITWKFRVYYETVDDFTRAPDQFSVQGRAHTCGRLHEP